MPFRTITTFSWAAAAVLAAVLSAAGPAAAEVSSACVYGFDYKFCSKQRGEAVSGLPRIIQVPAPAADRSGESAQRERKWLARCRPAIRHDEYGVGRYVYAARGCEFGRTED
jgi:hypothetical protein